MEKQESLELSGSKKSDDIISSDHIVLNCEEYLIQSVFSL